MKALYQKIFVHIISIFKFLLNSTIIETFKNKKCVLKLHEHVSFFLFPSKNISAQCFNYYADIYTV